MIEAPTAGLTVDPNVLNQATQLRFRVFHEAICYSSEVDEAALQSIPCPPRPSQARTPCSETLIESDNPLFAKVVQEVSGGDLRLVRRGSPPRNWSGTPATPSRRTVKPPSTDRADRFADST